MYIGSFVCIYNAVLHKRNRKIACEERGLIMCEYQEKQVEWERYKAMMIYALAELLGVV
jgi:hypothetical protein